MDVEGTIEFLIAQQARFAEQQIQLVTDLTELRAAVSGLHAVVLDLANTQTRTNEVLATLAERHIDLAQQHKITEQNLNALISTVDRHIAGHD
ncbi:MAG TPA: hypothetical protein VKJ45_15475 [Blastocatellia bacterium]|nr:hypothetical protein [Blastocatellia bacterium]